MQEFRDLKIFHGIDDATLGSIIRNSKIKTFQTGETILRQSEPSNGEWYIIRKGSVQVEINGNTITQLKSGDIFWEIALLNEEERTATITAIAPLEVIVISQDTILDIINNGNETINRDIMDRIEENLKNNR